MNIFQKLECLDFGVHPGDFGVEATLYGIHLAGEGEVFVSPQIDVPVGAFLDELHHVVEVYHKVRVLVIAKDVALVCFPARFYGLHKHRVLEQVLEIVHVL